MSCIHFHSSFSQGRLAPMLVHKIQTRNRRLQIRGAPRVIVRKPAQPTFDQKLIMAVAEPFQRVDRRPSWDKCRLPEWNERKIEGTTFVHPWIAIKAKKFKERLLDSKLVLVIQENSIQEADGKAQRNTITKAGFSFEFHNRVLQKLAFEGTPYDFLLGSGQGVVGHATINHTVYILGSDSSKLKQLMDILRKMPSYLILFGIVENQVLRRDQLQTVANYPSIDFMRGQLVTTLEQVKGSITSNLQSQQNTLSFNLQSYQLQKKDDN